VPVRTAAANLVAWYLLPCGVTTVRYVNLLSRDFKYVILSQVLLPLSRKPANITRGRHVRACLKHMLGVRELHQQGFWRLAAACCDAACAPNVPSTRQDLRGSRRLPSNVTGPARAGCARVRSHPFTKRPLFRYIVAGAYMHRSCRLGRCWHCPSGLLPRSLLVRVGTQQGASRPSTPEHLHQ
jgi:hypothetical protein